MDSWLPTVNSLAIAIGALYLIVKDIRSGSSSITRDVTNAYKVRNEQLDSDIKSLNEKVTEQGKQIANLIGKLDEKDRHISTLTELVQGRNPEMIQVLKEIRDFMSSLHTKMTKSVDELSYQTEILEKTQERSAEIDRASKLHVGDPIRVPVAVA